MFQTSPSCTYHVSFLHQLGIIFICSLQKLDATVAPIREKMISAHKYEIQDWYRGQQHTVSPVNN